MLWKARSFVRIAAIGFVVTASLAVASNSTAHDYDVPPYSTWTVWLAETDDGETPKGDWVEAASVHCPTFEDCSEVFPSKATSFVPNWIEIATKPWLSDYGPVLSVVYVNLGVADDEEQFGSNTVWYQRDKFAYSERKDGGVFGSGPTIEKVFLPSTTNSHESRYGSLLMRVRVTFEKE